MERGFTVLALESWSGEYSGFFASLTTGHFYVQIVRIRTAKVISRRTYDYKINND